MPWSLQKRDNKWCVVKEGGEVEGCHASRTDAIKHQRALYSNEARVASLYSELDALEEVVEEVLPKMEDHLKSSELVKIVVGNEQDRALTASVVQALEATNGRLEQTEKMALSLAAALEQISTVAPVVNVTTPDVHVDVPPAQVTVEAPQVTVRPPDVIVPPAQVTVNPVMPTPNVTKTITFERDFDGRVTKADVTEKGE